MPYTQDRTTVATPSLPLVPVRQGTALSTTHHGELTRATSPSVRPLPQVDPTIPPVSNVLFEEFPQLQTVVGPQHIALRCIAPQPYWLPTTSLRRKAERRLLLNKSYTGGETSNQHNSTQGSGLSRTAGAPGTATTGKNDGRSTRATTSLGHHGKNHQQQTEDGPLPLGGTMPRSRTRLSDRSRLNDEHRPTIGRGLHSFDTTLVTSAMTQAEREEALVWSPTYVPAHQQSCSMCHTHAINLFLKRERRIRVAEDDARQKILGEELQLRRSLYRDYTPQHNKYRAQVDSKLAQQQLWLTLQEIAADLREVEAAESRARAHEETAMMRMLRALRRCCYRLGWEKAAELEAMAKEELEKVKALELAEQVALANERQRREKLAALMIKQLVEQEMRVRDDHMSIEFKAWIKLLLLHREGSEQAFANTEKRLEKFRANERLQLENLCLQRRTKLEEEEKEARQSVRGRWLRAQCVLKEKPIIAKLAELPSVEWTSRVQKASVLEQSYCQALMAVTELEEGSWRQELSDEADRQYQLLIVDNMSTGNIEEHEDVVRRCRLLHDEESEWTQLLHGSLLSEKFVANVVFAVLQSALAQVSSAEMVADEPQIENSGNEPRPTDGGNAEANPAEAGETPSTANTQQLQPSTSTHDKQDASGSLSSASDESFNLDG